MTISPISRESMLLDTIPTTSEAGPCAFGDTFYWLIVTILAIGWLEAIERINTWLRPSRSTGM